MLFTISRTYATKTHKKSKNLCMRKILKWILFHFRTLCHKLLCADRLSDFQITYFHFTSHCTLSSSSFDNSRDAALFVEQYYAESACSGRYLSSHPAISPNIMYNLEILFDERQSTGNANVTIRAARASKRIRREWQNLR